MKRSIPQQQRILDNSFAKETSSGQFCDQRECCLMAAKGSIKEKAQTVLSNQKRHEVRGKGKKVQKTDYGLYGQETSSMNLPLKC
ncbi:hypothetical protein QG37_00194 [Candidozyma auris]|nr:hypothetical protein QG37_00194 [[Candida] auris]